MVRKGEVQRRIVTFALIFAMVLSLMPLQSVKASEVNQEISEEDPEVSEPLIKYIYVENPYQNTPGIQNIAVSFQDGINITNAVLTYEKEGTAELAEVSVSEVQEGTALFSIDYTDESQSGIYRLVKVTAEADGSVHEIDLNEIGIDSRYGVNQECTTEPDAVVEEDDAKMSRSGGAEEPGVEATFFTLDDEGELTENDTIGEAIETANEDGMENMARGAKAAAAYASERDKNLVIVLDPGHGGSDGGASGNGANEKDLTLKITKYCREELEKYSGVTIYMTRETDKAVDLSERVDYAKQMGANVFISFHLNSTGLGTAKGAEVYYPNSNYRPNVGSQGAALAQQIQNELVALGIVNRGIKIRNSASNSTYPDGSLQDYYAVIQRSKRAGFPGLIIEHAFIDNTDDFNRYLSSDAKLKALGLADAQGIANYFGLGKGEWKSDDNGWKFQYTNGTNPKSTWEFIAGFWYYFDADGYRMTGFQTIGGAKYYLEDDGKMKIGWLQSGDKKYYFDVSGAMQKGWLLLDGSWYYMDSDGAMTTGFQTISGKKYYLDPQSGIMIIGWRKIDGKWYYFNGSGHMMTGWVWVEDKCYYMDESGVMAEDTWIGEYYVDKSGAWIPGKKKDDAQGGNQGDKPSEQKAGWIKSGDLWWYRHADGSYTKSDWEEIDGKRYYFDASGWMKTGWLLLEGKWYYLDASGAMKTGWQWVGGKCYYMDESGVMAADTWIGEDYVDGSGAWVPGKKKEPAGWIQSGSRWWYRHSDGSYTKSNWEKIDGTWYYFDASGWMKTGWLSTGGKWYYLSASGAMATGWTWVGSKCYYLDASGAMAADTWIGEYYVDGSGAWIPGKTKQEPSGWIQSGDRWWYRHSDGSYTKSNWEKINSKWYYFDAAGWMKTGWLLLKDTYYYLDPASGAMQVGWLNENGSKYYLNPQTNSYGAEGSMAKGYREIDGEWYFFNKKRSPVGALYYTGVTPIMGESALGNDENTVVSKMVSQFTNHGKPYPGEELAKGGAPDITEFCKIIYQEALIEGVRPEVVFAQVMLETGYLQFGGDVKIDQFNFAGIGAIGGGEPGERFQDVQTGLRAQVQHLKAYASNEALNQACVDPRFNKVTRNSAPYIEWLGIQENPTGAGWAGGAEYGFNMIKNHINPMLQ